MYAMKRISNDIRISAPVNKVWNTVFDPTSFGLWTEVFTKGSYYVGSLETGAPIRFLAKNKKGEIDGMVSEIAENIPHEYLSIRHLGWIFDGVDDTESEDVRSWAPAFENYRFTKDGDSTVLTVEADLSDEYAEMFTRLWPLALQSIKEISEEW